MALSTLSPASPVADLALSISDVAVSLPFSNSVDSVPLVCSAVSLISSPARAACSRVFKRASRIFDSAASSVLRADALAWSKAPRADDAIVPALSSALDAALEAAEPMTLPASSALCDGVSPNALAHRLPACASSPSLTSSQSVFCAQRTAPPTSSFHLSLKTSSLAALCSAATSERVGGKGCGIGSMRLWISSAWDRMAFACFSRLRWCVRAVR